MTPSDGLNAREAQLLGLLDAVAWRTLAEAAAPTDASSPAVFGQAAAALQARGLVARCRITRVGDARPLYRLTHEGAQVALQLVDVA